MLMSKHVEANKRPLQKKMFQALNWGESLSKLLYHQIANVQNNAQHGEREPKFTEIHKYHICRWSSS